MLAQQSPKMSPPDVNVPEIAETVGWEAPAPEEIAAPEKPKSIFARIRSHDWIVAVVFTTCDVVCWVILYGVVGYLRRDAFLVSPFEFVLVDLVALGVLVQAIYIIGGYNRNTDMRSLTYTTEHILAVAAAAALSSLVIYSAATFDQSMKPSRGVLLVSFMAFLPLSLFYRRLIRRSVAATTASRAFLVVGSGQLARDFYETYKRAPAKKTGH